MVLMPDPITLTVGFQAAQTAIAGLKAKLLAAGMSPDRANDVIGVIAESPRAAGRAMAGPTAKAAIAAKGNAMVNIHHFQAAARAVARGAIH
jgi:hypothetical protein